VKILANRPGTIYWRLEDADGNLTNSTGSVTVAVTRQRDGLAVATGAVSNPATGKYQATIAAPGSAPELLNAVWTAPVSGGTVVETVPIYVVTSRLVALNTLRHDDELAGMADWDVLRIALEAAEDECVDCLGYPPIPVMTHNGIEAGGRRLTCPDPWPRTVVAATRPNLTPLTSSELALLQLQEGAVVWQDNRNWDAGTWDVYLIHGRWDAPPWDLSRAVLVRTRYLARRLNNKDDMPERASSVATEGGTITFAFPTLPRPTGLPEVDIVYMRYALASELPVKV
jgi:hypothetical protein